MKGHRKVNFWFYTGLGLVFGNTLIVAILYSLDIVAKTNAGFIGVGIVLMIIGYFTRHNWEKWSEPHERTYQTYDAPPALVLGQELKTYRAEIQDRHCRDCRKYQWRKV